MPASIPESMTASRSSLLACCVRIVSVVRPSASVSVSVFRASPSGMPSYTSVETIRSFGTISRYSPWKATSNPPSVTITYRHMPPTRRSISATFISPRWPLHQRLTSSGVVHALYTRCLGASNSRVMRICSSPGSITFAVLLLVTAAISFLLQFLQYAIQPVEPLRPRTLIVLHPVVDGLERAGVQPVQSLLSLLTHVDRSHLSEHPQVLGDLRLGQPEQAHQIVHGALTGGEDIQDLSPPGLGHRIERVRCRRCSCHGRIIFSYGYISSPRPHLDGERAHQLTGSILRVHVDAEAPGPHRDASRELTVAPYFGEPHREVPRKGNARSSETARACVRRAPGPRHRCPSRSPDRGRSATGTTRP